MPETIQLDIPINQSPIPAALDMYYDFVKQIAAPGAGERLAIFGTITNYDINALAPLYDDYVVRAFSDRTVRTSPISSLGAGDLVERYSARYVDMLALLVASMDATLSDSALRNIDRYNQINNGLSTQRDAYLDGFEAAWRKEMVAEGIDPTKIDTDSATAQRYYERRVVFMKLRHFAEGLANFNDQIDYNQMLIDAIRINGYPDDEAREIVQLYKATKSYQTTRPRRPDLEIKYKWDQLTIENPEYKSMPDIFDIGPMIESIVDPRVILAGGGARGFAVSTSSTVTNDHDNDWNVSGSAGFMSFISGNFQTSSSSHFRSTLKRVRNVAVNFAHVGMLDVTRGGWFSSQIFGFKRVQAFLKDNQDLARKMNLLTASLIVGRGLTLELKFTDSSDVREWGSSSTSGGGGVSFCGWDLGTSGGSSSSWDNHQINESAQTVTFVDDPSVCRLLGVKVSQTSAMALEDIALGARPIRTIPRLLAAAERALGKGEIVTYYRLLDEIRSEKA